MTTTIPPVGLYVQIYRDAIPGRGEKGRESTLLSYLDQLHTLHLPGVVMHGTPLELRDKWDKLAEHSQQRSLLSIASWGLDSTKLTAQAKGQAIGEVLARPSCVAGLMDQEFAWDEDEGDGMSESSTVVMYDEIRRHAPDKPIGDQPWFAMLSHGDVRRKPGPLGRQDVFVGFPVDEVARYVNWARFRQAYCNNFLRQWGKDAYERVFAWMDRDWKEVDKALAPQGLQRQNSVTIQAYRWNMADLTHCLLDRYVKRQQSVILWSDPFPTDDTLKGILFVTKMVKEGFAGPGIDPKTAVKAYQIAYNKTSARYKLDVDGAAGELTVDTVI